MGRCVLLNFELPWSILGLELRVVSTHLRFTFYLGLAQCHIWTLAQQSSRAWCEPASSSGECHRVDRSPQKCWGQQQGRGKAMSIFWIIELPELEWCVGCTSILRFHWDPGAFLKLKGLLDLPRMMSPLCCLHCTGIQVTCKLYETQVLGMIPSNNTGFDILLFISRHRILVIWATSISAVTLGMVWRLRLIAFLLQACFPLCMIALLLSKCWKLSFSAIPITDHFEYFYLFMQTWVSIWSFP